MTEKTTKSVRLPADVAGEVERQADERDLSESDMLRRCIERGLVDDTQDLKQIDDRLRRIESLLERPLWRRFL